MKSQLLAYREGTKAFDLPSGSGFVLTIDLDSDDVKVADEKPTAPHLASSLPSVTTAPP
jgi:hypothetical protein